MEVLEVSAKSVEEAISLALNQLGVSRSEVEIEVLSKGRSGILGIGAEEARVRVTPLKSSAASATDLAKEALERLVALMGISATVRSKEAPVGEVGGEEVSFTLDISGDDLGILIGRRGETLSALQYVVNLIVGRRLQSRVRAVVDVEGYRQRREEALRGLALRMAERVKTTGRIITLEPMPANERRIVHLTLCDDPDVVTQSLGEGESRKVAISLRRDSPRSGAL